MSNMQSPCYHVLFKQGIIINVFDKSLFNKLYWKQANLSEILIQNDQSAKDNLTPDDATNEVDDIDMSPRNTRNKQRALTNVEKHNLIKPVLDRIGLVMAQ